MKIGLVIFGGLIFFSPSVRYLEAVDGLRLVDLRVEDIVVEIGIELTKGGSQVESCRKCLRKKES